MHMFIFVRRLYIKYGRSHSDVTHWFVKARFEALIFTLPGRHLGFLEPEVTIFGGAKGGSLGGSD